MKRYAIQLAYDGTSFSGWQRQKESRGIQEVVEEALERISGEPTPVIAAGRTDGGVHARGQVISFSLRKEWDPEILRKALDFHLENSIRAIRAAVVSSRFSARKDALWREYVYQIWDAPFIFPHVQGYTWWIRSSWNWEAVRQATEHLRGNHDFTAFCRAGDLPENPRRTISAVSLARRGPLVRFRIRGKSFLTNMVRIILGCLAEVGRGRRGPDWIAALLRGASRTQAGPTAPPAGLCLWKVGYEPSPWIPLVGLAGNAYSRSEGADSVPPEETVFSADGDGTEE